jgi:hypothetical protein
MTEAEWDACADPQEMLAALGGRAGERKLRLFACACCWRVRHRLSDPPGPDAVEVLARLADGLATGEEWDAALDEFAGGDLGDREAPNFYSGTELGAIRAAFAALDEDPLVAARNAAAQAADAVGQDLSGEDRPPHPGLAPGLVEEYARARTARWRARCNAEGAAQAGLLRCVFGNPFRPLTVDPAWRTPAALALARSAYDERHLPSGHLDPVRVGVLADALEEAGATDAALLGHLRGAGPHVRGCHAVDAVVGLT